MPLSNVSADLIWEIVRNNNAYLVKSKTSGGVRFSRDPLNLTNQHSRKHAGFVNDKAVGVSHDEKGGVVVVSKTKRSHQPARSLHTVKYGANNSTRKTYKSIANSTAKSHYRPDLRQAAVARASSVHRSQRPVREAPEKKLRGAKAKKAAEKA